MKRIVLFIAAFALWLLLTHTLNWQSIAAGIVAAFIAALIFGGIFAKEAKKYFNPIRWFWFICYLPIFIWACIKANLDVAYRVLSPWMPIKPGIVKIKTNLKSETAKTFLANTITMTPGTLSVDIDGQYLYIHWIYVRATETEEASKKIAARFEWLLAKIFD